VRGVGIVNAMEILEAFDMSAGTKDGLVKFKRWLDGIDVLETGADIPQEVRAFHEKHRSARATWTTPDGFPSDSVLKAYQNPVVDESTEAFSWGSPDEEGLHQFCNKIIGWRPEDTRRYLDPVIHKPRNGRQTRIDSFMSYEQGIKFADVRSKRLRKVLGKKKKAPSSSNKKSRK